jgi:hypothetical protein
MESLMRRKTFRELFRWLANAPDPALDELISRLEGTGPPIIRDDYSDGWGGECLAEVIGKHHPACSRFANPGQAFISLLDLDEASFVVTAWDERIRGFKRELLDAIRQERDLRVALQRIRRPDGRELPRGLTHVGMGCGTSEP